MSVTVAKGGFCLLPAEVADAKLQSAPKYDRAARNCRLNEKISPELAHQYLAVLVAAHLLKGIHYERPWI